MQEKVSGTFRGQVSAYYVEPGLMGVDTTLAKQKFWIVNIFPTPPELNVLNKSQTYIIKLSLKLYSSCPLHSWTSLFID
jgi:hypothetical protein